MKFSQKQRLEELKSRLQQKLALLSFVKEELDPFCEILAYLKQKNVSIHVENTACVKSEWIDPLSAILYTSTYADNDLIPAKLCKVEDFIFYKTLFDRFPSSNTFHYEPIFPIIGYTESATPNVNSGLQKIAKKLALPDQKVYLFYLNYAPLIEVTLSELLHTADDDLFNIWHGVAIICPQDLTWLISFGIEDKWFGGK